MNRKFFALTLAVAILAPSAFAKDVKVHVKGMVCAFCGQGITKKFNARPEIEKIDVSLKKKIVTLSLKEKLDIKDEDIKQLLVDSGYTVEKIERQ